jgi:hypothetical protein
MAVAIAALGASGVSLLIVSWKSRAVLAGICAVAGEWLFSASANPSNAQKRQAGRSKLRVGGP